jgi:hypothetical protein
VWGGWRRRLGRTDACGSIAGSASIQRAAVSGGRLGRRKLADAARPVTGRAVQPLRQRCYLAMPRARTPRTAAARTRQARTLRTHAHVHLRPAWAALRRALRA